MKKQLLFWMGMIFPLLLSAQWVPVTPANSFVSSPKKPVNQFDNSDLKFLLNPTHHPLKKNHTLYNFKTSDELKMGLDSILAYGLHPVSGQIELGGRYLFQYNYEGLLSQEEVIYRDENTMQWIPMYRTQYLYNPLLLLTEMKFYAYDETSGDYLLAGKQEHLYNANNLKEKITGYAWDQGNSVFVPTNKIEIFYNGLLVSEEANYDWDNGTGAWIGDRKYIYEYSTSGNLIKETRMNYSTVISDWEYYWKEDFTYNTGDTLVRETNWEWDEQVYNWIEYSKREYEYGNNPIMYQSISYSWEIATSSWEPSYKHTFILAADTSSGESIDYYWTNNLWKPTEKDNYVYDVNFNITSVVETIWDEALNKWENEYWLELTHDLSYAIEDIMIPPGYELGYMTNNMITENVEYNWNIGLQEWELEMNAVYYYSEHLVSGNQEVLQKSRVQIFPNPSNETIQISSMKNITSGIIEIFDISGKPVLKQTFDNTAVNVQTLSPGTYLYRIVIHNKDYTGKLVVY